MPYTSTPSLEATTQSTQIAPSLLLNSGINVHLLRRTWHALVTQLVDRHVLADVFSCDDLFIQDGGRALLEAIIPSLLFANIWLDVVPQQSSLLRGDDTDVNVRS